MSLRDQEFGDFFQAEFRPLRRLGFLLTGDWGEAEDLAQEAMVRTYKAWSRIANGDRPGAYARACLVNRHRSLLRRAMVEAKHATARMPDRGGPEELDVTGVAMWEALRDLPLRQRQALVLRFYEDLPEAEVAELLGCPVGTVKSLVHRGLARLREAVGERALAHARE